MTWTVCILVVDRRRKTKQAYRSGLPEWDAVKMLTNPGGQTTSETTFQSRFLSTVVKTKVKYIQGKSIFSRGIFTVLRTSQPRDLTRWRKAVRSWPAALFSAQRDDQGMTTRWPRDDRRFLPPLPSSRFLSRLLSSRSVVPLHRVLYMDPYLVTTRSCGLTSLQWSVWSARAIDARI